VFDDNNWVVNKELPTIDDGFGNINNHFFPESNTKTVMQDITQIRTLMNKIHSETTKKDAQIFLH